MSDVIEPGVSKRVEIAALVMGAGGFVVLSFILLALALLSWGYRQVDDSAVDIFLPYILIELVVLAIAMWVAFKNNYWIKVRQKIGIFIAITLSFALTLGAFLRFYL